MPGAGKVLTSDATGLATWVTPTVGTITSVTGSGNIASSGGTTPNITFTGILPIANGGTNIGTIGAAGAAIFSNGTQHASTAVGTAGQVLTSAGAGTPTWTTPTVGTVTGSGTLNYVPKWTPNGTTLGNSLIFDNGTNVGVGTAAPAGKLDVNGTLVISNSGSTTLQSGESGLWMHAGTGNLYLADSRDWDRYLGLTYTPGVTAAQSGVFTIGQVNKNSATFTHGVTNFYTNGVERVRINNAGNVGIGTAAPAYKLEVYGATASYPAKVGGPDGYLIFGPANTSWSHFVTDRPRFYFNTGGTFDTGNIGSYDEDLSLQTSGTTRISVLNSNGNVGIGTTAPVGKLHIAGLHANGIMTDANDRPSVAMTGHYPQTVMMAGGSGNASHGSTVMLGSYDVGTSGAHKHWSIGTAGNGSTFLDIGYSATDINPHAGIRNYAGSTFMTILNTGNVGIGTLTPTFKLHVPSGYIGTDYINTTDNGVTGTAQSVSGIMVKSGDNYHRTADAASVKTFLGISTLPGDNLGNHIATTTLNMNANVISNIGEAYNNGWFRNNNSGIGLYNQATGNHFYSDGVYWNIGMTGASTGLRLRNAYAGALYGYFYADASGIGVLHGAGGWSILSGGAVNAANTYTAFYTSSAERMRIDAAGNVGIGTIAPTFKLHVPSGYIGTDYINTTDNSVAAGVTGVMIKAGDNYLRTGTAAALATFLNTTGTWIPNNGIGDWQIASSSTGTSYNLASLELRESNFTGNGTATPPRLGFHWGGVVASQIAIESNGRMAIRNNPGTGYENLVAKDIYADGGWFRAIGNQGFYFESWGGGWYMADATWIRSYGGKNVYVDAQLRADGGLVSGGIGSSGAGFIEASRNIITNQASVYGNLALTGDLPGYPINTYPTIKTSGPYMYFSVGGAYSAYMSSGGVLTAVSDRDKKGNIIDLDPLEILKKIDQLPITQWNYKMEGDSIKHIGPMAQDFHVLFGLNGSNNKMISHIDPSGVALAGIKGLSIKVTSLENSLAAALNSQQKANPLLLETVANLETIINNQQKTIEAMKAEQEKTLNTLLELKKAFEAVNPALKEKR